MKYIRRIVWFFASRLLALCLILGLMITVFYYTMNLSNIQIVLKDGMANRAKTIMGMEAGTALSKYFMADCLANDTQLSSANQGGSPYANYNVRGIDHRLDMGYLWIWPWESKVKVSITEKVPKIDGRVKGTKADEVIARNGAEAVYPPSWPEAEYSVLLEKENGQWKIKTLSPAARQQ